MTTLDTTTLPDPLPQTGALARKPARLGAGRRETWTARIVFAVIVGLLLYGWANRDHLVDPHTGIGYALGIIGGVMMLILLAYPVRKRVRVRTARVGSVGFWFRFHMLLGLFGPLAILFHARFSWGALNSAFAMGAMIVVATSGIVGRFFYARVHRGYSDRKLELRALRSEMDSLLAGMERAGFSHDEAVTRLVPFEQAAVAAGANFWSSAASVLTLAVRTRRVHRELAAMLRQRHPGAAEEIGAYLAEFFEAVRRAAQFAFYDRLLRLWHLLHLPLFFLLVAAAILHVIAVHMY